MKEVIVVIDYENGKVIFSDYDSDIYDAEFFISSELKLNPSNCHWMIKIKPLDIVFS